MPTRAARIRSLKKLREKFYASKSIQEQLSELKPSWPPPLQPLILLPVRKNNAQWKDVYVIDGVVMRLHTEPGIVDKLTLPVRKLRKTNVNLTKKHSNKRLWATICDAAERLKNAKYKGLSPYVVAELKRKEIEVKIKSKEKPNALTWLAMRLNKKAPQNAAS